MLFPDQAWLDRRCGLRGDQGRKHTHQLVIFLGGPMRPARFPGIKPEVVKPVRKLRLDPLKLTLVSPRGTPRYLQFFRRRVAIIIAGDESLAQDVRFADRELVTVHNLKPIVWPNIPGPGNYSGVT